ncbi:SPOR domain-containing protein [Cognatilysobacter tabacisoli]|uniref:SPOR domain-containing protein n=1 Tax=Cognatilysobacter tabacisoli TaxID=2315424 RepID=UPI000E6AE931|nr:SPOR domain-containing protein [Lysobacter tabacisoli]
MAARRGKSQARRNAGSSGGGLPGWAWLVLGVVLTIVVVLAAPKVLKSDGNDFFRPQPNPDAQPAAVGEDDTVVPEGAGAPAATRDDGKAPAAGKDKDYDFYTLLPGKEVEMSDAELAATERAEAAREAQRATADDRDDTDGAQGDTPTAATLPAPVDSDGPARPAAATPAPAPAAASPSTTTAVPSRTDDTTARYLLQAGAFQASGQAEELKARIALLGLGARVESAAIGGKTVYRVRMGPYGTAGELAEAKRKLASGGLPAMAIQVK